MPGVERFPVSFAKFLRTDLLWNTYERLADI